MQKTKFSFLVPIRCHDSKLKSSITSMEVKKLVPCQNPSMLKCLFLSCPYLNSLFDQANNIHILESDYGNLKSNQMMC